MDIKLIAILVLVVLITTVYRYYKNKSTASFLGLIKDEYVSECIIEGDVRFSSIHILYNIQLKILLSKEDISIIGYDYYRHRKTKFLFHSDKNIADIKANIIPNYFISDIILSTNNITIYGDNGSKIIIKGNQSLLLLKADGFNKVVESLKCKFN